MTIALTNDAEPSGERTIGATKAAESLRSFAERRLGSLTQWILPLVIIAVWQAAVSSGLLSTHILPAPIDVVAAGWRLLKSGELLRNMWVSFWRAMIGFVIGGGIGFAFGLANGLSRRCEAVFDSTLQMVRNIPHVALIPLVILWFGIDETAKIFLVALGVFFPIYINTQHGIRTVDPQLVEMGASTACRPRNCSGACCCRAHYPRSLSACASGSASCGSL
jgi:sulfonate transport system permease protein